MAKRFGFGQVEPNHLSAMRTHQIYAQLPAATDIKQLENGQFAYYNGAAGSPNGEVALTGPGEPMLVLNEVKLYGEARNESYKDFVLKTDDFLDGKIYPRLYKTNVGDIYTTNCFESAGSFRTDVTFTGTYTVGKKLIVNAAGFLEEGTPTGNEMAWIVVDDNIGMPDGTFGVKIQRIQ